MSSISMNDFVTFNPSSAAQTPPIHYTPNSAIPIQYGGRPSYTGNYVPNGVINANQPNGVFQGPAYVSGIYGQAQIGNTLMYPNGAGPDDVSMNASFQTELNQLQMLLNSNNQAMMNSQAAFAMQQQQQQMLQSQQYLQQSNLEVAQLANYYQANLQHHHETMKAKLINLDQDLQMQRQVQQQTQDQELKYHLMRVKDDTRECLLRQLEQIKEQLQCEFLARQGISNDEAQIHQEKDRIKRRWETRLQEEKRQIQMIQQLELQRIKVKMQTKLNIEKQKLEMLTEDEFMDRDEIQEQQREYEEMLNKLEEETDILRYELESNRRKEVDKIRREVERIKDKEQTRIQKWYSIKLQEDQLYIQQSAEDQQDKKEQYIRELREKQKDRLTLEQEKLVLLMKEKIRTQTYEQSKVTEKDKIKIKAKLDLKFQQYQNEMLIEFHQQMRELQLDKQDKYKMIMEKEFKDQQSKLEQYYRQLQQEMIQEQTKEQGTLTSQEKLVKEIESLKRLNKEKRTKVKQLQIDIESSQLVRTKLQIKFNTIKQDQKTNATFSNVVQELEQQIKTKEQEISKIKDDVNRISEYKISQNNPSSEIAQFQNLVVDFKEYLKKEAVKLKNNDHLLNDNPEKFKEGLSRLKEIQAKVEESDQLISAYFRPQFTDIHRSFNRSGGFRSKAANKSNSSYSKSAILRLHNERILMDRLKTLGTNQAIFT